MAEVTWGGQGWSGEINKKQTPPSEAQAASHSKEAAKPHSLTEQLDAEGEKVAKQLTDLTRQLDQLQSDNTIGEQITAQQQKRQGIEESARDVKGQIVGLQQEIDERNAQLQKAKEVGGQASEQKTKLEEQKNLEFKRSVILAKRVAELKRLHDSYDREVSSIWEQAHEENKQWDSLKGRAVRELKKKLAWEYTFGKLDKKGNETADAFPTIADEESSIKEQILSEVVHGGVVNDRSEAEAMYQQLVDEAKNGLSLEALEAQLSMLEVSIKEADEKFSGADKQQRTLAAEIATLQQEAEEKGRSLKQSDKEVKAVEKDITKAEVKKTEHEQRIAEIENAIAEKRTKLGELEEQYKQHLREVGEKLRKTNLVVDDTDRVTHRLAGGLAEKLASEQDGDIQEVAWQLGRELVLTDEQKFAFTEMQAPERTLADLREVSQAVVDRAMDAYRRAGEFDSEKRQSIANKQQELNAWAEQELSEFVGLERVKLNLLTPEEYAQELSRLEGLGETDPQIQQYKLELKALQERVVLLSQNKVLVEKNKPMIDGLKQKIDAANQNLKLSQERIKKAIKSLKRRFAEDNKVLEERRSEKAKTLEGEVAEKMQIFISTIETSTKGLESLTPAERKLVLEGKVQDQVAEAEIILREVKNWHELFGLSAWETDPQKRERARQHLMPLAQEMVRHDLEVASLEKKIASLDEEVSAEEDALHELRMIPAAQLDQNAKGELLIAIGSKEKNLARLKKTRAELQEKLNAETSSYPQKLQELQKTLLPADLLVLEGGHVEGLNLGDVPKTALGKLAELTFYGGTVSRLNEQGMRVPEEQKSLFEMFGGTAPLTEALDALTAEVKTSEEKKMKSKEKRETEAAFSERVAELAERGLDEALAEIAKASPEQIASMMKRMKMGVAEQLFKRLVVSLKIEERLDTLSAQDEMSGDDSVEYRNLLVVLDAMGDKLKTSSSERIKKMRKQSNAFFKKVRAFKNAEGL